MISLSLFLRVGINLLADSLEMCINSALLYVLIAAMY